MDARSDRPAPGTAEVQYRETLRTPWWWYPVALGVGAVLAAEFHVAGVGVTDWVPYVVLLPLAALIVWSLGRGRVEISGGELRIRGAHLPLEYVSGAVALDSATMRRVIGREGDPAAYVSIRPWIGPGVQVWIDDEEDPTPYWVVSSRYPDRLVDAVRAAR